MRPLNFWNLWNRQSIAVRYTVLLLSFCILMVSLLAAFTYLVFESDQQSSTTLPKLAVQEVGLRLEGQFLVFDELGRVGSKVVEEVATIEEAVPMLQALLASHEALYEIALYDRTGSELFYAHANEHNSEAHTPNSLVYAHTYFKEALKGKTYFTKPMLEDGAPVSYWVYPIFDANGTVRSVLRLSINITAIQTMLQQNVSGTLMLVAQDGSLLLSTQQTTPYQNTRTTSPVFTAYLNKQKDTVSYRNDERLMVYGAWVVVKPNNWLVIAEIPVDEAHTYGSRALLILALLLTLTVCALIVGYLFFVRNVSQPLTTLLKGIKSFGSKSWDVQVDIDANKEFQSIAGAFNEMAQHIAKGPQQLSREVEKRTHELDSANRRLRDLLQEIYQSSKILVRKDLEYQETNDRLLQVNKELDAIGKVLVKRDYELTKANQKLEELDVVKSEFVSVAAHQLRTPLTGIRWIFRGLAGGEFGALTLDQKKVASNGLQATMSAIGLINDLLDVARMEGGRFVYSLHEGPLCPHLQAATSRFEKAAQKKGLTLSLENCPEDVWVRVDTERFAMVLDNILDNAIKYSEPSGDIEIKTNATDKEVAITISDSGIGIPKEQLHRIFQKFFRAQNAILLQTSGSGLGLYLAKNIVEHHKGTIDIKSEAEKGTTVYIRLPRSHTLSSATTEKSTP